MDKITKLIDAFKNRLPDFDQFMNKGASDSEIEEAEKYIGNELPSAYKQLLKVYNGEKAIVCAMGFRFLSTEELKMQWKFFANAAMNRPPHSIYQLDLIKPLLFDKDRIPFAHDGSGNFLCIDYAPGNKGQKGQIIYLPCGDPEPISVISSDFNGFVQFLIHSLNSGRLALIDERQELEEDEWDLAEIHFYKTWKDDWTDIADEFNNSAQ